MRIRAYEVRLDDVRIPEDLKAESLRRPISM